MHEASKAGPPSISTAYNLCRSAAEGGPKFRSGASLQRAARGEHSPQVVQHHGHQQHTCGEHGDRIRLHLCPAILNLNQGQKRALSGPPGESMAQRSYSAMATNSAQVVGTVTACAFILHFYFIFVPVTLDPEPLF